jgi:hypothetical protein
VSTAPDDWYQANQRYLTSALSGIRRLLEAHVARAGGAHPETVTPDEPLWEHALPPALEALCRAFGLSPFERAVLLLCAGPELDASFGALCAEAQGNTRHAVPTFSLALAALPEAHWSALTPAAPLRRWQLLDIRGGETLATGQLRVDERVLHYLAGVSHLDERLQGLAGPVPVPSELPASQQRVADRLVALWMAAGGSSTLPVVQLCGSDVAGRRAVTAWACDALGLRPYVVRHADIPQGVTEREALARLWDREAALGSAALLVEVEEADSLGREAARSVLPFVDSLHGVVVVSVQDSLAGGPRTMVRIDVATLTRQEQLGIWQRTLGPAAQQLDGAVDAVVAQFDLGIQEIETAGAHVLGRLAAIRSSEAPVDGAAMLWDACRKQTRPRLDDLAQRIEPDYAWADLVLPEPQLQTLRQIAAHVRHRTQVYETWGFAGKNTRGLGISALFAGPSGTGKTMAAEVLASELRLDLYRIDLSQVVSKYIGETEKNLRRVFDAAEESGSILLFDEADALFGKRSEVKDSHDRYANIEVSYLLQRMESYRGLAVLTTNMRSALDAAFLRRIRFVVSFPFPDAVQRAQIWRQVFPRETPLDDLDERQLARLNVTGGSIRNIALNAAFIAADEGTPVRMSHLLLAARTEYTKLGKPLTDAEAGGWT